MPECPIEQEQTRILIKIAENGSGAVQLLSDAYLDNEVARAAMKGLVFDSVGNFARSLVIEVMGEAGEASDAENVLMHLLGHEKGWNRKKYREHGLENLGNALVIHRADKSGIVRERAVLAVEKLLGKRGVLSTESGVALVKCALVDPSEKVRVAAARIIGKHADSVAFSQLFTFIINAEKTNNWLIVERGKEAVAVMVAGMKADRPRGSFLKPLIWLSTSSEEMWNFGANTIMELFEGSDLKEEIRIMVLREMRKLEAPGKEKDRPAIERMGALLDEMGKDFTTPIKRKKKMTAEKEIDPGELMKPPAKMKQRAIEEDPIEIQRGPIVDAVLRAGRALKKIIPGGRRK